MRHASSPAAMSIASCRSPSLPQTTGPIARLVGRADHRRTGAVGEDHRGRPVVQVGEVGEPLAADHEGVARRAGADRVGRGAERVAPPRAAGVDVEGARSRRCRAGGRSAGRGRGSPSAGWWWRASDQVDVARRRGRWPPGPCRRRRPTSPRGSRPARPSGARRYRPAALDPLVVGVHALGELVVGHPPPGAVARRGRGCARPGLPGKLDLSHDRDLRVETGDRVSGVDEVALVDQPLGQYPVVGGGDMDLLAAAADGAQRGAGRQARCPRRRRPG